MTPAAAGARGRQVNFHTTLHPGMPGGKRVGPDRKVKFYTFHVVKRKVKRTLKKCKVIHTTFIIYSAQNGRIQYTGTYLHTGIMLVMMLL